MKRLRLYAALLTTSLLGSAPVLGTDVGGLICTDTTWHLKGSPYLVRSGVVIGCDATLTIGAGVEVRLDPATAIIVGSNAFGPGTLIARGTRPSRILFTSGNDHPAPGDWSRIHFTDYAIDAAFDKGSYVSGCILEYVTVEYAGFAGYAAIFAEISSPFLTNCEVRHNSWSGIKGWIPWYTDPPPMRIQFCGVSDNAGRGIDITGGSGHRVLDSNIRDNGAGGIYFYDAHSSTISGNTITSNTREGQHGGGIALGFCGNNALSGNTITGNTAGWGGGGICLYYQCTGNTLSGNTITGNTASSGGGICVYDRSSENTLSGNTITGNTASGGGGGISLWDQCTGNTLSGNTITGNTADVLPGGGIYLFDCDNNTVSDNTITGNTANNEGGGICVDWFSDNNTLTGNIISRNHTVAGQTGGVFVTDNCEWLSLAGNLVTGTYNVICCNDGYQVYNNNPFNADGRYDVDARYVQWCTEDSNQIEAGIYDWFDDVTKAFVPWDPYLLPGDINGDGTVNLPDVLILAAAWGTCEGDPNYNPFADLNCDGCVNLPDLLILAGNWGETI